MHERKAPPHKRKAPSGRLSGDGSAALLRSAMNSDELRFGKKSMLVSS